MGPVVRARLGHHARQAEGGLVCLGSANACHTRADELGYALASLLGVASSRAEKIIEPRGRLPAHRAHAGLRGDWAGLWFEADVVLWAEVAIDEGFELTVEVAVVEAGAV